MARRPLSQLNDWTLENDNQDIRGRKLYDRVGNVMGTIRELIVNTDTEYVDAIVLDNGKEIPASEIEITTNDVRLLDTSATGASAAGRSPDLTTPGRPATAGHPTTPGHTASEAEARVPIIEEELQVGKRPVQRGGIRVTTRVEERPVSEQVTLRDETVNVHREAVDRPATDADMARVREGTFEVTETDEEAVIRKEARVTGEVHIDKQVEERTEEVRDTVRRTDVDVEKTRDRKSNKR